MWELPGAGLEPVSPAVADGLSTTVPPGKSCSPILFLKLINLFIYFYFWLCWVFVAARGLSLVAASGATLRYGARASHCGGFSCCGARALGGLQ